VAPRVSVVFYIRICHTLAGKFCNPELLSAPPEGLVQID
jgi:hypothetical protein